MAKYFPQTTIKLPSQDAGKVRPFVKAIEADTLKHLQGGINIFFLTLAADTDIEGFTIIDVDTHPVPNPPPTGTTWAAIVTFVLID